ncbi:uncharacterized protein TRIVIDRAFT_66007 [Trichoderma virens Gv29-8]|uniref:Uncharacterized protein n=1 Tax=Hypocrea virens (strain Gv29-8 / FGSC 10586) TaxID=413071 RepID=G9N7T4_HYPVG|nr:uncharacterized protein TRIVIDRAFT_66007 [Trichoderma virens Gv29-8]EHK17048.1 hypothetical protein TRIVIDRAFT_66007 [Trichoderma virens Gv29-8]
MQSHPRQFVNALLARRRERATSTALMASAPASSEEDAVPPILPSGEETAVPTMILRSEENAVPPTMVPSQEDAISPAPGSSEDNAAPATGPPSGDIRPADQLWNEVWMETKGVDVFKSGQSYESFRQSILNMCSKYEERGDTKCLTAIKPVVDGLLSISQAITNLAKIDYLLPLLWGGTQILLEEEFSDLCTTYLEACIRTAHHLQRAAWRNYLRAVVRCGSDGRHFTAAIAKLEKFERIIHDETMLALAMHIMHGRSSLSGRAPALTIPASTATTSTATADPATVSTTPASTATADPAQDA